MSKPELARVAPSDLVNLNEGAKYLGVSSRTLRRRIADGHLPGYRVGPTLVRVRLADLDALLRPIPSAKAS